MNDNKFSDYELKKRMWFTEHATVNSPINHGYVHIRFFPPLPDKCPVTGVFLNYGKGESNKNKASIDRIDNTKGYIDGNIWIVSVSTNSGKRNKTLDQIASKAKESDFFKKLHNAIGEYSYELNDPIPYSIVARRPIHWHFHRMVELIYNDITRDKDVDNITVCEMPDYLIIDLVCELEKSNCWHYLLPSRRSSEMLLFSLSNDAKSTSLIDKYRMDRYKTYEKQIRELIAERILGLTV